MTNDTCNYNHNYMTNDKQEWELESNASAEASQTCIRFCGSSPIP